MSTATIARPTSASTLSRILAVVRLQFTNPWSILIMPWLILLAILVANIVIWLLILTAAPTEADRVDIREGLGWSGAGLYIFVYMLVVAVQAISGYFPFALGYGVTRRNYYLGIALTFVLLSVLFTAGLTLLSVIEEATGGWFAGGHMFTALYFGEDWLQRAFVYFVLLLFFFFTGSTIAAIWVRWKGRGMAAFFIGLGFFIIGVGALITLTRSWGAVGSWLDDAGLVGTYAWSLVITLVSALAGYGVLRRATPKG